MTYISRRRLVTGVIGLSAALVLGTTAACSDSGAAGEQSVLRWAASFPAGWDPVATTSISASYYQSLVYEPLVRIDADYNPVPALAESWKFSDTGDAVTFTLRPDAQFSNGEKLDAAAVKAYFDRAKSQETSLRVEDYRPITSVTVDSDYVVTLNLDGPNYQILYTLGTKGALISAPEASKDPEKLNTDPVGAGPFKVTEFVPDDHIYLEKNPNYWAADKISIDRVELTPAPSGTTVGSAVQTGVYDFASIPTVNLADATKLPGVLAFDEGGIKTSYIDLNTRIAPFDNPKVVEAIHHAINRQELYDKVAYGVGKLAGGPFLEGSKGYVKEVDQSGEYDPEAAKKLLAEVGPISFDIVVEQKTAAAEIVQAQLKAVGITTTIKVDPKYRDRLFSKKDIGFTLFGGHNFDSDAQTLSNFFGQAGRQNLSGYEPAGLTEALAKVRATPLDSPEYTTNLQAATKTALQARTHIFYQTYIIAFIRSERVSVPPHVPNEVSWIGVTISPEQ